MIATNITIFIGGQETNLGNILSSCKIFSTYNGHHKFQLSFSLDPEANLSLEDIKRFLGEKIEIQYLQDGWISDKSGKFVGFVDDYNIEWDSKKGREIHLNGWSISQFLDCAPKFRCFANQSLSDIVNLVLKPYKPYFTGFKIQTKASQQIKWTVQDNLSDYDFLKKLAAKSGYQECWDDGTGFFFFDDLTRQSTESIHLVKNENLNSLNLSLNTAPMDFQVKAYDYINGQTWTGSSKPITISNTLVSTVVEKSKYPVQQLFLPYAIEQSTPLQPLVRRMSSKQAHQLVVVSGNSNDPRLIVGSKVVIDHKDDILEREFGTTEFTIITINHQLNADGRYTNNFIAVPTSLPFNLPMPIANNGISGTRAAIVADNADPLKMARVKVQYIGDDQKAISPWIRTLSSYTSDGGEFLIPKKDEQVMVFHEGNDFENSALVLGSFYHAHCKADWDPRSERGLRMGSTGILMNKESINTWADKVQLNARKNLSLDANKKILLACNEGAIPKK